MPFGLFTEYLFFCRNILNMWLNSLLLIIGLWILIKGAGWLVNGSSVLAKRYRVSDLVIGLTIVAFGTSAPELVVSLIASAEQLNDIVLGNVMGSNIANLFLILGISGLIFPLTVEKSTIRIEIPLSLLAAIILFFLANNFFLVDKPVISRIDGLILLLFFWGFLVYVFHMSKKKRPVEKFTVSQIPAYKAGLIVIAGLAALIVGGKLVVDNAVKLAQFIGISEKIIGFTIIAVGTSLPELATSVVAAMKKNPEIAVGNIIGSNIFNIFLILGTSSVVSPIAYNKAFNPDFYLLAAGTILLLVFVFTGRKYRLDRGEAAILLLIYLGYITWLILKETIS